MLHILVRIFIIFEEVPVVRWAELVHELSLLQLLVGHEFVLFALVTSHNFFVGDALLLISFDEVAKAVSLVFVGFEALKDDEVFDVLAHVLVDVFKGINGVEPGLLLLGIVVPIPNPSSAPLESILPVSLRLQLVFTEWNLLILFQFLTQSFLFSFLLGSYNLVSRHLGLQRVLLGFGSLGQLDVPYPE